MHALFVRRILYGLHGSGDQSGAKDRGLTGSVVSRGRNLLDQRIDIQRIRAKRQRKSNGYTSYANVLLGFMLDVGSLRRILVSGNSLHLLQRCAALLI